MTQATETARGVAALEAIAQHLKESNQLLTASLERQKTQHEEVMTRSAEWVAWNKETFAQGMEQRKAESEVQRDHTTTLERVRQLQAQMIVDNVNEQQKRLETMESLMIALAKLVHSDQMRQEMKKRRKKAGKGK